MYLWGRMAGIFSKQNMADPIRWKTSGESINFMFCFPLYSGNVQYIQTEQIMNRVKVTPSRERYFSFSGTRKTIIMIIRRTSSADLDSRREE